ncbi:MAG: MBL fold metallo-hydrolase [Planctomycetes bacterium]|nr:MBL fold metallo-hydrolase [Planctomycetota bacterium]
MAGLRFVPLGVGDAFSARWYSSCLALEAGGAWLLVDCPHPIRKMMREASATAGVALDVDRLAGVVVTHLHADHASGLEGLGYFSRFALRRPAALLAHPEVVRRLWDGHLAAGMEQLLPAVGAPPRAMRLDDYFAWTPLDQDRPVDLGPFTIECRPTIHHIPTTALRIRAGGRSLGYSADTAFDAGLIEWLAAADLVVHETNLGVHTPYASLAALPAPLRAKMRLIHFPDDFDLAGSVIEPLEQGRRYEV